MIQDSPGVWRVSPPGDAADADDAAALLEGLRRLRPSTRLTDDASAYGLSPRDATVVRAAGVGGNPAFAARFGRRGLGRAVHMAAEGGGDVFLGTGPPPELLERAAQDWRDRRLLGARCARVELNTGGGWRAAAPATAAMLCGLRATAVLPPLPPFLAGLDRPVLRVRGASGGFSVGALMGGERWISVDGRAALFRAPAAPLAVASAESRASRVAEHRGIIIR